MQTFDIWVYQGIIAVLLIIVGYFAKGILTQLKEMNANITDMSEKLIGHEGKFELLSDHAKSHERQLTDHQDRIRRIERKQDLCPTCSEVKL